MTPKKSTKKVREFIGIVKYYRKMWNRRSNLLQPLTVLTSNMVKFKWTDGEQKAFDDIKRAVTQDTLSAYPDFNKRFDIHEYVSDYKLGPVVILERKHIAFYSRKRTGPQTRYTVTERNCLI